VPGGLRRGVCFNKHSQVIREQAHLRNGALGPLDDAEPESLP
jgi:hypothetical protein